MKAHPISSVLILLPMLVSCQRMASADKNDIESAVKAVLNEQVQDWNEGDIEKFMTGYYRSDSLRFASGGSVYHGWTSTLERYKRRYPDKEAMGILTFSEIDISVTGEDAALVFGRWELQREKDKPEGLFTLLFQKTEDGWRIVHDHTSSETN